jgi:nucleoside phosphorylase
MEAAAIAWVCKQLDVPFVALKAITDVVDDSDGEHTETQFYANLEIASARLQQKLTAVLELLGGSTLESWR